MAQQHFTQADYSRYGQNKNSTQNELIVRQRKHAINKCRERFGFELTIDDYRAICSYVKQAQNNSNKSITLATKIKDCIKIGNSIWKIVYNNKTMYALWDSEERRILTFLTKNMVNRTDFF